LTKETAYDLGPLDTLVGFHLRRASFVFSPDFRKSKGVPRGMFGILSVVATNPGINQTSLGGALGIDTPNLVPLIDAVVERGLLKRSVDPKDRRSRVLNLTPGGHNQFKKTLALVKRSEDRMLTHLSKSERAILLTLLKRIHVQHSKGNSESARAVRRGINTPA
jgi:DNA-binding MarR family transcriptional regulator